MLPLVSRPSLLQIAHLHPIKHRQAKGCSYSLEVFSSTCVMYVIMDMWLALEKLRKTYGCYFDENFIFCSKSPKESLKQYTQFIQLTYTI